MPRVSAPGRLGAKRQANAAILSAAGRLFPPPRIPRLPSFLPVSWVSAHANSLVSLWRPYKALLLISAPPIIPPITFLPCNRSPLTPPFHNQLSFPPYIQLISESSVPLRALDPLHLTPCGELVLVTLCALLYHCGAPSAAYLRGNISRWPLFGFLHQFSHILSLPSFRYIRPP